MSKIYARIHPEARNGTTPVRLYDTAGISFTRGGGSYKGWYPVTNEQVEKLRRCHVANGNPNSMRVFQVEEQERVDEISASEARSKMAPEQQRIDVARDGEIAKLKQQVQALAPLRPLLDLIGTPDGIQRLSRLIALDKASSGAALSEQEGEIVTQVATAPPRRASMSDTDLDADEKRVSAAQNQQRTENKPAPAAPAPPARPGARPGASGKKDAKNDKKDEPKGEPVQANIASLPPSLPSDISAAMDPSIIDEDDDHDV